MYNVSQATCKLGSFATPTIIVLHIVGHHRHLRPNSSSIYQSNVISSCSDGCEVVYEECMVCFVALSLLTLSVYLFVSHHLFSLALALSLSLTHAHTRTRIRTNTVPFSVFRSPSSLPHSRTSTLSGLVAVFMWNGESPSSGPVACAQSIDDIQNAQAAHALDLMLACLNQVLKYAYRS